jgi:PTH2 family peptidyl-tRNA hydrolase
MRKHFIKQVIILRKDLNMRKGKMAAQASHASMAALVSREKAQLTPQDDGSFVLSHAISKEAAEWFQELSVKIVVGVGSEKELLDLYEKAQQLNLPCSLIQDAGLTEFGGIPTYTAVGIGPCESDLVDPLTQSLPLL